MKPITKINGLVTIFLIFLFLHKTFLAVLYLAIPLHAHFLLILLEIWPFISLQFNILAKKSFYWLNRDYIGGILFLLAIFSSLLANSQKSYAHKVYYLRDKQ
jgi:type IV secretory pathway VirB3-like protein